MTEDLSFYCGIIPSLLKPARFWQNKGSRILINVSILYVISLVKVVCPSYVLWRGMERERGLWFAEDVHTPGVLMDTYMKMNLPLQGDGE